VSHLWRRLNTDDAGSIDYICRALSTAGLEATDGPAFERYDARFDPRTGSGGFEIWVPVSAESLTVRT